MRTRLIWGLLLITLITGFGLTTRMLGARGFQPLQEKSATPDPDYLESVLYEHFFKSLSAQDSLSIKSKADLVDEDVLLLRSLAEQCIAEIAQVDGKARPIIEEFRAKASKAKSKEELPPPPAELAALQRERNAVSLRYRDMLRKRLGDSKFLQINAFARAVVRVDPIVPPTH